MSDAMTDCYGWDDDTDGFETDAFGNKWKDDEFWQDKCYKCVHSYHRVDDADTLYCRCRTGCHFKEYKPKNSC